MDEITARQKYDLRSEETVTIKSVEANGTVHTDSWSWGGHPSLVALSEGDRIVFETVLATQVVGARYEGSRHWLFRKATDELVSEHNIFLEGMRRREDEVLDQNREDWTRREAKLPKWLRDRLRTFHQRGGEKFDREGWGYELTICEIAVLLLGWGMDDDAPAVMEYARENGTTGNQHSMAMALARAHREDPDFTAAGTVSALSPLTGSGDYS